MVRLAEVRIREFHQEAVEASVHLALEEEVVEVVRRPSVQASAEEEDHQNRASEVEVVRRNLVAGEVEAGHPFRASAEEVDHPFRP